MLNSSKNELPKYSLESDEMWKIDLRSSDLTELDLKERFKDLIYADLDNKTKWSDKLLTIWKNSYYDDDKFLVLMDSRCAASPTGTNDYVFYRKVGISRAVPYVAGLYALVCQVNPDITPEIFWKEALNTSETIFVNNKERFGKIVNPAKWIEKIEELK